MVRLRCEWTRDTECALPAATRPRRVVYVKHPVRTNVFLDIKHMAMALYQVCVLREGCSAFACSASGLPTRVVCSSPALRCAQEKFEEFAMVMRALGAKTMAMNSTSETSSISGNVVQRSAAGVNRPPRPIPPVTC